MSSSREHQLRHQQGYSIQIETSEKKGHMRQRLDRSSGGSLFTAYLFKSVMRNARLWPTAEYSAPIEHEPARLRATSPNARNETVADLLDIVLVARQLSLKCAIL